MPTQEEVDRTYEFTRKRKRDYQSCFKTPAGKKVLDDLAVFCRFAETCFNADPRVHAALEGRREVWLRIQNHLNFSPEELAVVYRAAILRTESDDG